ncbi:MAG: hypothetical protein NTU62_18090 [Spirochaetes bacterium]|nr:hypothetical protein [Spirochaetota bacterium]
MGWTLVAVIAVNLAALTASWFLLRGWLARRLSVPRQAADLGEEVGRLVVELNQATERNVVLLEDRVSALNDLMAAADKKIGVLRREIERHEAGTRVYGQLATPSARAAAAAAVASDAGSGAERAAAVSAQGRTGAEGRPAVTDGRPAGPVDGKPAAPDARTAMRAEIGRLARAGIAAAAIAARVGAPLGEVELILSLEQRARGS